METMRLVLLLSYDGRAYSGWQIQEGKKKLATIQGTLEAALLRLVGTPVRVFGSGRTDAGVHACGQVVHCDVPCRRFPPEGDAPAADGCDTCGRRWRQSLNALLPADIRVIAARQGDARFHARISALHKTYFYNFWLESAFTPPQLAPYVWSCGPLQTAPMQAALQSLLGEHDFASFRNVGTDTESSVRTIFHASLHPLEPLPFFPPHRGGLRLHIRADGFLKQMVRNIAGFLVLCGRGKCDPASLPGILQAQDRRALPSVTAPPQGLFLAHVAYPEGEGFVCQLPDLPAGEQMLPLEEREEGG